MIRWILVTAVLIVAGCGGGSELFPLEITKTLYKNVDKVIAYDANQYGIIVHGKTISLRDTAGGSNKEANNTLLADVPEDEPMWAAVEKRERLGVYIFKTEIHIHSFKTDIVGGEWTEPTGIPSAPNHVHTRVVE